MYRIRSRIFAILILWPMLVIAQSHDFKVQDFRENTTDLTTVSSNVKDLNGRTAALIRFAVRDTLFSFEANNGIIKQKKEIGEVLLFVPQGTKRITIRHPYLGILRDYQLPLSIESKTTYDAEIVITNTDYLRNLMGSEQRQQRHQRHQETIVPIETKEEKWQEEKWQEEPERYDSYYDVFQNYTPKPRRSYTPPEVHFMLGGGFNALTVMGPTLSVGVQVGKFELSADYTIGMQEVEGVGIFYKAVGYNEELGEAYDYSASRFSARLGLNFSPESSVQVVPMIGASFNMIKGKEVVNKQGNEAQFSESYPISLSGALSLRIRLFDALYVTVTPQYDFAIGADDVFKVIKSADSKIKAWGEGMGIYAGLMYHF